MIDREREWDEDEERKIITIEVISARFLPKSSDDVTSPFVTLMVHGAPQDCASRRTSVCKVDKWIISLFFISSIEHAQSTDSFLSRSLFLSLSPSPSLRLSPSPFSFLSHTLLQENGLYPSWASERMTFAVERPSLAVMLFIVYNDLPITSTGVAGVVHTQLQPSKGREKIAFAAMPVSCMRSGEEGG